jgi:hypothetical protein
LHNAREVEKVSSRSRVLGTSTDPPTMPVHEPPAHVLPRWAHVADVVSLVLLVVAVAVLVGGGFRLRLGAFRLAATSPVTPWLLLLLIAGLRHAFVPRPSLPSRLRQLCRGVVRSDSWHACWGPFALTRVGVVAVGFMALVTIGYAPGEPNTRLFDDEVMNLPVRWDAGWYYQIAKTGYYWNRRKEGQQNIAFFPAFPMATRGVARLFGGEPEAYILAGLTLSHGAFLWALWLLHRLARELTGDAAAAAAAVLLIACYPFALFYGAFYTESFFLLGSVGAMRALHRNRPAAAGAFGLLAGLTRPNGFLLAIPLLVLALRPRTAERLRLTRTALLAAAAIGPLLGVAIYSAYLATLTGDPLAWYSQHAAWGRTYAGLAPVADAIDQIAREGAVAYVTAQPYTTINVIAAGAAVALILPVWRRVGAAYGVFVAVNVLPPLVFGGALSMGRVTATMFPIFLWLAIAWPRQAGALAGVFALFQGFAAVLFYTWRPLY